MSDLRRDPISGNWVIISREQEPSVKVSPFELWETPKETCPFCPGRESLAGGEILSYPPLEPGKNGSSWSLRVIPNRVPVLRAEVVLEREGLGMFDRVTGVGAHEVFIDTPDHSLRLANYSTAQIQLLLRAWRDRLNDLFHDSRLRYISIFKSEGRRAGACLSHPHSELIATPMIPVRIRNELAGAREYFEYKERCVFCDLVDQEREEQVRIVTQNRGFVAFCPFSSRYPFEISILPRKHHHHYGAITDEQIADLAHTIAQVTHALSVALLKPDLNLILKTAPNPPLRRKKWTTLEEDFHWTLSLIPRLTRLNAYEWGTGMFINPTPPEDAADCLRQAILKNPRESE